MTIATLASDTTLDDRPGKPELALSKRATALTDESEIAAAIARGDRRTAIGACARMLGAPLGRLCFAHLSLQSEADEAVQETLLAAYDGMDGFRGEGSVRAWLFGIGRKICARRLEVRTRQARRSRLLATANDVEPAVDVAVDEARRTLAMRAALAELRPTEREAVLLRFEGELSYREVGEACGVDEAAARKRVGRALARLRERLVK